jgi:hypothetical protein
VGVLADMPGILVTAFREKGVDQRFRLRGSQALIEQSRFALQAIHEREFASSLHGIDRRLRCGLAAQFLARLIACCQKDRRVGVRKFFVVIACPPNRLACHLTRERHCSGSEIAVDDPVDDSRGKRLLRLDRSAKRAHL